MPRSAPGSKPVWPAYERFLGGDRPRRDVLGLGGRGWPVAVAEAPHGLDRVLVRGVGELATQVANVELDLLAGAVDGVPPGHLQELVVAEHLVGVPRERGEEAELGWGEIELGV